MIFIFDLDGTLANIDHRLHYIQGEVKNWDGFFASCVDDKPIENTIEVLNSLHSCSFKIWIMTGRSDIVEAETHDWLYLNDVNYDRLIMRKEGDHQPDVMLKEGWLNKYFPINNNHLMGVFEDRKSVVDMWRRNGVLCYQVASGEF